MTNTKQDTPEPTIVYSPAFRSDAGAVESVTALIKEIRNDKWRIWEAFKRNFRSNYAETVLGVGWSLILPLVPIGVYVLLASMRVVTRAEDIPFVLYICIGVTVYGMATGPIQDTIGAIRGEGALLSKTNVGVITVVLSRFGQLVWDTLVRLVAIVAIMVWIGVTPSWGALLTPIAVIPLFVLALSLGLICGILNTVAKDIANIVGIIIRYGFFFSSVIFPMPTEGTLAKILLFNPFNTYVIEVRNLLVKGRIENLELFLITSAVSLAIFLIAAIALRRSEARLRSALA